jgi:hypothetical protein
LVLKQHLPLDKVFLHVIQRVVQGFLLGVRVDLGLKRAGLFDFLLVGLFCLDLLEFLFVGHLHQAFLDGDVEVALLVSLFKSKVL